MDLTKFHYIEYLNCDNNQIDQLNVSNLDNIETITCCNNQIGNLNLVGSNAIKTLLCNSNTINELYVDELSTLDNLQCNANNIRKIVLPNTSTITKIECSDNHIKSLNIENTINLVTLNVRNNELETLPSIIKKDKISNYNFTYNNMQIAETNRLINLGFDKQYILPQNITIKSYDPLTTIDIKVGEIIKLLAQIPVKLYNGLTVNKDVVWGTPPSSDNPGTFTVNGKIDGYFDVVQSIIIREDTLSDLEVLKQIRDLNPGRLTSDWADNIPFKQWSGVTWLTGDKYVKSLDIYNASINNLAMINNPKQFTQLTSLSIALNPLTTLEVDQLQSLKTINANDTSLGRLSYNKGKLVDLQLNNVYLTNLDLSSSPRLTNVNVQYSKLNTINVSNCPSLTIFNVNHNELTNIDTIIDKGSITEFNITYNNISNTSRFINMGFDVDQVLPQNITIKSNDEIPLITIKIGDQITLRPSIIVELYNGMSLYKPITWNAIPPFNKSGLYTINGFIDGYYKVKQDVYVLQTLNNDLEILKFIRNSNPDSILNTYWSDTKDPYTQWTGVVWDTDKRYVTYLEINSDVSLNKVYLDNLTKLERVTLKNCNNLSFVSTNKCKSIYDLSITDNIMDNLDITDLTVLKNVFIANTKLKHIDLQNKLSLESIYLCDNNLENVRINNCPSTRSLRIDNNKLRFLMLNDVDSSMFYYLTASNNNITDAAIPNSIKDINISNNYLSTISTVTKMDPTAQLKDFKNNILIADEIRRLRGLGYRDSELLPQRNTIVWHDTIPTKYVKQYEMVGLQPTVNIKYADGTFEILPIKWEPYNTLKSGTFNIAGYINYYYLVTCTLIVSAGVEDDLSALRELRDMNPLSRLPSLWLDSEDPYTQWEGVTWDETKKYVLRLNISNCNLTSNVEDITVKLDHIIKDQ